MENIILEDIFKGISLSQEELRAIAIALKKIALKKGDILLRSGESVLNTHYVHNGCLRTYFIDDSGKDHTLQFAICD